MIAIVIKSENIGDYFVIDGNDAGELKSKLEVNGVKMSVVDIIFQPLFAGYMTLPNGYKIKIEN